MYLVKKTLAFIAIIIAALSTLFCPFLKVFLVGNWNLYQVDERLYFITNGLLALILLFVVINKASIFRFLSIVFFIWCVLAVGGVYFQTNNFFGMKLADGLVAKSIQFKWGWIVLFITAIMLLLSVSKAKKVE